MTVHFGVKYTVSKNGSVMTLTFSDRIDAANLSGFSQTHDVRVVLLRADFENMLLA